MDLGTAVLRRSSINALIRAVHPRHGLAWTDGQSVFLSPVTIHNNSLVHSKPVKLGEFEAIQSLSWSCDFAGKWCYLCVVQFQKISIWRVEGDSPALKLKLVRKISKNPVPCGSFFNPTRDILVILTADQCTLYYRHSDKKSSLALPVEQRAGLLRYGSWSDGGDKLYVSAGATVWVFHWASIDTKIKEFVCRDLKVPGVDGAILAMAAIGQDYLLISTELPLDAQVKTQNMVASFEMEGDFRSPTEHLMNLTSNHREPITSSACVVLLSVHQEIRVLAKENLHGLLAPDLLCYMFDHTQWYVVVGSNAQSTLQFYTVSSAGLFKKQHDIILPSDERPKGLCPSHDPHAVFILLGKLTAADNSPLSISSEAHYDLKLSRTVLYPSDPSERSRYPAVSSSKNGTQPSKLISLMGAEQTVLDCGVTLPSSNSHGVLSQANMTATNSDALSLTTSTHAAVTRANTNPFIDYPAKLDRPALPQSNPTASNLYQHPLSLSQHLSNQRTGSTRSLEQDSVGLVPQNNMSMSNLGSSGKLVRPISQPNIVNSSQGSPVAQGNQLGASYSGTTQSQDENVHNSTKYDSDPDDPDTISSLKLRVLEHESIISRLRRRVEDLSVLLEETHLISANHYQDLSRPDVLHMSLELPDGSIDRKAFLLDRGRLRLDVLTAAFGVPYLQLHLDGLTTVLTSNVDGYIPLRFECGAEYVVSCGLIPSGHPPLPSTEDDSKSSQQLLVSRNGQNKADRLKELIQADRTGNAMRLLQLAAEKQALVSGNIPLRSQRVEVVAEPVKPPRKGSRKSQREASDDSTASSGSFVDVTAAL